MNRRTFFATLAAPFVARLLPKANPFYPTPNYDAFWRNSAWCSASSSPIADIDAAIRTIRTHAAYRPDVIPFRMADGRIAYRWPANR